MKSFFYLFIILGFTTCKSAKVDGNAPFQVTEATYNYWTGGQPGVSGIRIVVHYKDAKKDISLDKIYFQNKEGEIETYTKDNTTFFVGRINTSKPRGDDLILDIDPKKEMNNKLPKEKIPFDLKENEAMVIYTYKGESHHFKIKNIKKTKSEYFP
jgi:hypothetical protein